MNSDERRIVLLLPRSFNGKADFNGRPDWYVTTHHLIYFVMNYYEFGERSDFSGRVYSAFFIDRKTLQLKDAIVTSCDDLNGILEIEPGIFIFRDRTFHFVDQDQYPLEDKSLVHKDNWGAVMGKIWKMQDTKCRSVPNAVLQKWAQEEDNPESSIPLPPFQRSFRSFTGSPVGSPVGSLMKTMNCVRVIQCVTDSFPSVCSDRHKDCAEKINLCQSLCKSRFPDRELSYYDAEWMSLSKIQEEEQIAIASHLNTEKELYLWTTL